MGTVAPAVAGNLFLFILENMAVKNLRLEMDEDNKQQVAVAR